MSTENENRIADQQARDAVAIERIAKTASHAERAKMLDAIPTRQLAELQAFQDNHTKDFVALTSSHRASLAAAEQRAAAARVAQSDDIVAFIAANVRPVLAAYGSNPRKQADAFAKAWRIVEARTLDELGERAHPWVIVDSLAGGDDVRTGHSLFGSFEYPSSAMSFADAVARRVAAGAGSLETMQLLSDLGPRVERDLASVPDAHISEQTAARAQAARSVIAFNDFRRALLAVDARYDATRDEKSATPPNLLARILR